MSTQATHDNQAADGKLYPDLPSFVGSEAEFRAAVRAGIASFEAGPTHDLATVEAELRDLIHGKG